MLIGGKWLFVGLFFLLVVVGFYRRVRRYLVSIFVTLFFVIFYAI